MRLRQAVIVSAELERTVESLCDVLAVEVCFRDPGVAFFGLENALMPVGDTFLEVVSPTREGTTAGRYLDRRGGDGGYMLILQVDAAAELEAARRRLDRLGIRVVWEGQKEGTRGMHLHPRDVGGAILSLDASDPPESWAWAGEEWQSLVDRSSVGEIVAVEIGAEDPAAMATRWGEVLDRPAVESDGGWSIELDGGVLRFVRVEDARCEGLGAIGLACSDRERVEARAEARGAKLGPGQVELGGVVFRLL
jgi:hypothetical protein